MNEEFYEVWEQIRLSPGADERIYRFLRDKQESNVVSHLKTKQRRLWQVPVAAVFVLLILTGAVWAVSSLCFSEISKGVRLLNGIEEGRVPEYIQYEDIWKETSAYVADPQHTGEGEVYVSVVRSVRSENFLTVDISLWSVTEEQYEDEDYVWRAALSGNDEYMVATPVRYTKRYEGGDAVVRIAVMKESITSDVLELSVFGGYETDSGKGFHILRAGTVKVDVPDPEESTEINLGEGLTFYNKETGEASVIAAMEVHEDCVIIRCHAEGIYELWEQYAENDSFRVWNESLDGFLQEAEIVLKHGTTIPLAPSTMMCLPDDTWLAVMYFEPMFDSIEIETVAYIRIAGSVYKVS